MGFLKGLFGKSTDDLRANLKKVENRDLMEAIVGGCLLVAAADGDIEDSEVAKIDALIQSNESLKHFGSEITGTLNRFTAMLKAGFLVGRVKILRELGDVKNNANDAQEVFANMVVVALADGEVEPEELKVLKEVASLLGQRLSDFGIEG